MTDPALRTFRPDIEGLRALAVTLVLAYHVGVPVLSGGFVGVDVFFVLSGFLITGLLVRETEQSGRVSLREFWARRARRILPASALVLCTTVVAARWMIEPERFRSVTTDALAAVGFSSNLVFAARDSDYLSGLALPSPLLHFWSLAVEEQFYLVWPLVAAGVARAAYFSRRVLGVVATIVAAVSLLWSAQHTADSPASAYYLLPTRAWELLAGAALACMPVAINRIPGSVRAVGGWLGLGLVGYAAFAFNAETVFPGVAATVPVVGTVLALSAGEHQLSPFRLLSVRPALWIGARSYSLYLWHWPVLVLAEARFGVTSWTSRLGLIAVALLLSALTYRLVENPVRHNPWIAARSLRGIAVGASCALAASVVAVGSMFVPVASVGASLAVDPGSPAQTSAAAPAAASTTTIYAPSTTTPPMPFTGRVLLVGDSTLAPIRWFEQGKAALNVGSYDLDAESCRRLALQSCRGRERRTPGTVVDVLKGKRGYDTVVVMAGYHSTPDVFADEFARTMKAATATGARKVVWVTYRESLHFPKPGSRGKVSQYQAFNRVLEREASSGRWPQLVLADWNSYAKGMKGWFVSDGIHTTITGTLALGEWLSGTVAQAQQRPCPVGSPYPSDSGVCAPGRTAPKGRDLLATYGVRQTKQHCYQIGASRQRECRRDSLQ